uniref:Uncharacterized protein LOC113795591 n=1 Tax=Dermatophagoides pteronyssinus TaxID=6956 RepID=A0A6P6Y863_DERPT|nr:uncharacterized protein LOC113795591 [Dermatophagoides pteronyssinus]
MSTASLTTQLLAISVISLQRQIIHNNNVNRTSIDNNDNYYDYIIIGSGSSGAVVANRLAALNNQSLRILLLEAGGPQSIVSDMPGMTPWLVGTEMDWQYLTVPQQNIGQAFRDHRIRQPKGKVIGGTSTINWMLYNRGNRHSYDNWYQTYGCDGWDYNSILPYFIRSENNTSPKIVSKNPGYHGTQGPIGVSPMYRPDPMLFVFQKQMNSFGIPTLDINGANQLGTMIYELTVNDGKRCSTGNSYLDPNPYPENLHIMARSLVTRILFERNNQTNNITAVGVEFNHNGNNYTVRANREVILSAGCIGSPQLLLLSGVGPRKHLEELNITVIADLPVGENFQDHVFIHHYYEVKNLSLLNEPVGPTVQQLYNYYINQNGPLTQLPNSITFFSTKTNDNPEWPNAVIDVNAYMVLRNLTDTVSSYGTNLVEWENFWSPYLGKQYLLITSAIYRTYSRGTIRLASRNPFEQPLIDPQYLSDERDLQALVDMTKILFYVTQTGEFTKYAEIFKQPIPGCQFCTDRPLYQCDSYVRCIIRQVGDTALHPGGACRMGSINRTDIVVDTRLRVKGIDRLRVIDSSVIPELANANTHAASVMIGERGVQFIIDELTF